MREEFNYFHPRPVQNSIGHSGKKEYTPISALHHGAPIEFFVPGLDQQFLNLSRSEVYIVVQIQTAAGANPGANTVSTINLPLHSLFSNVEVIVGDKTISDANGLYPQRAYMETLLDTNPDSENSELQKELWYRDTPGQFQAFACAAGSPNIGLVSRAAYFTPGAEVELLGRLHCDVFQQGLPIPSKIPLKLRFTRTTDEFILVTPAPGDGNAQERYKIVIVEMRLFIEKIEATASMAVSLQKMLSSGKNLRLDFNRRAMKHFTIPEGHLQALQDNVFMGPLPRRIIMAMVRDVRMAGGYQQNPFHYEHFDLNFLALHVNDRLTPGKPYTPDFEHHKYIRSYDSPFDALGVKYSDRTLAIKRRDYPNGYTLWGFDLTLDHSSGNSIAARQVGSIRMELKFRVATPSPVNVILYGDFDASIEFDQIGNVITDF